MSVWEKAIATGVSVAALLAASTAVRAEDADLAKQLNNPVGNLISVPFQFNYDWNIGPDRDGERLTINVQPVIPFDIGDGWLMVSRTIMPIISQQDIFPGAGDQFGLGDTLQSFFFVPPPIPIEGGSLIVGVGPALLLPTGTRFLLSSGKWGAGPTGVGLVQIGGLTAGALANHLWSYAGSDAPNRSDVSQTFVQPFASYTTADAWTFGLSADMTYNWKSDDWSIPVGASVSKLVSFGDQPVSLGGKARYYAVDTESGPHGWALQATMTFLFPSGE